MTGFKQFDSQLPTLIHYLLGGQYLNATGSKSARIYELDILSGEWNVIGNFLNGRKKHALSLVSNENWNYCKSEGSRK